MITKIQITAVNEMCKLSKELGMSVDMNKIVKTINKMVHIGKINIVYSYVLFTAEDVIEEHPDKAGVIERQKTVVINADLFGDSTDDIYIECCKLYYLCKMFG